MIAWKNAALAAVLALAAPAPGLARQDAAEELSELQDEYQEAYEAYRDAYRAAETDEARGAARELRPMPASFTPRFLALAQRHPKTDAARDALVWIATNGGGTPEHGEAMELLGRDHLDHDAVGMVLLRLGYGAPEESTLKLLERAAGQSASRAVRGQATFALALLAESQAEQAEGQAKEALVARYVEHLERVLADYADVPGMRGPIGASAEAELFEHRHLQVGMVAPDIVAEDLDGVEFKLSDYRGKVVLLDFWGHW